MNADDILAKISADQELPEGWVVFSLLKSKIIWGLFGWILGVVMGFGLLGLVVPIVIPSNYQRGTFAFISTTVLLAILLFISIGSLWMLIVDILRLVHADQHKIVLTNTDFVKREGPKIIKVPLIEIRHVTPRGRAPIDRSVPTGAAVRAVPGPGESVFGMLFGRGTTEEGQKNRSKRMRTPTSLAFMDDRDQSEVTVVNDDVYGDPFSLATILEQYVFSAKANVESAAKAVGQERVDLANETASSESIDADDEVVVIESVDADDEAVTIERIDADDEAVTTESINPDQGSLRQAGAPVDGPHS